MTLFIEEYEFLIMNRAGCLIGQKTDEGVKEVSMVIEGINALPVAMKLSNRYGVEFSFISAAAFLITFQKAPIDSPNKPIRSPEKRGRMRRGSFLVLAAAFLFAFFFLIRNSGCGYALLLAVLWQAFTLTPPGIAFIGLVDRIFSGKAGRSY